jgi:hypothetical protein
MKDWIIELCPEIADWQAELIDEAVAARIADERERLYGKDIDTLLFEEHRLGFEKGSRSEREACAKEADKWSKRDDDVGAFIGKAIRARGETK